MKYENLNKQESLEKVSELISEALSTLYVDEYFSVATKLENCLLLLEKVKNDPF